MNLPPLPLCLCGTKTDLTCVCGAACCDDCQWYCEFCGSMCCEQCNESEEYTDDNAVKVKVCSLECKHGHDANVQESHERMET